MWLSVKLGCKYEETQGVPERLCSQEWDERTENLIAAYGIITQEALKVLV